MEEVVRKQLVHEKVLGRRIVVVLPVMLAIMFSIVLYMSLPIRYYFSVSGGNLCLMAGRVTMLGARCEALVPIPAKGLNLSNLTDKIFETQGDALAMLRGYFNHRIAQGNESLFAAEAVLADLYTGLLRDMKGAKAAGVEGLDKNINVLQGWLEIHAEKSAQMSNAKSVKPAQE